MLVGTIAFNTLAVIDPASSGAFSIWVLGYIFQGLGMAIAFIVGRGPFCCYGFAFTIIQFITVHFYRAIRYGFHRYVSRCRCKFSMSPIRAPSEAPLRVRLSFPLAHQVTLNHSHHTPKLNAFVGFTALAILQLGSWGRKM